MNSMQPHQAEHGSSEPELFGINLLNMDVPSTKAHTPSFGNRLHAARETRGLDLEACAHTLKLPVRVLRQLERDEYDGIDSKIYLASYVGKYGRYLGINEASIQVEMDRIKQVEPTLVATGGISHSRFLLDRYATAATYVVLTAVIVVPMIWLGVRGTLDRDLSHLAPLDAAPVAQQDAPAAASSAGSASHAIAQVTPPSVTPQPAAGTAVDGLDGAVPESGQRDRAGGAQAGGRARCQRGYRRSQPESDSECSELGRSD